MKFKLSQKVKIIGILVAVVLCGAVGLSAWYIHQTLFGKGLDLQGESETVIYISEKDDFEALYQQFLSNRYLIYPQIFRKLADRMNYTTHVRSGRYTLRDGMSNREVLLLLRSGEQTPVKVTFNKVRYVAQLAGVIASQIRLDSLTLDSLLRDDAYLSAFEVNAQTVLTLFIPNTYEFFWDVSADDFMRRMYREYNRFWTDARETARKQKDLNRTAVSILASIVEEETQIKADRYMVAGVYLNRLRRHIPLQADPTVRYALGDFTIHRVLTHQLDVESPYNTYYIQGLPVGPICLPSIEAIDAVLFAPQHDYFYFCTAPDLKNLVFAKSLQEHNRNASAYHRELNRLKVWK